MQNFHHILFLIISLILHLVKCCENNQYQHQQSGQCVAICDSGYLGDIETQKCIPTSQCQYYVSEKTCRKDCPQNTMQLEKSAENEQKQCVKSCGNLFISEDGVSCVKDCGALIQDTIATGKKCIKKQNCQKYVSGNICTDQCSNSQFYQDKSQKIINKEFSDCVENCDTGLFKKTDTEQQQCVKDCGANQLGKYTGYCVPEGTCSKNDDYIQVQDKQCINVKDCKLNIQKKEESGLKYNYCLTSCQEGLFLKGKECVKECDYTIQLKNLETKTCIPKSECQDYVYDKKCTKDCLTYHKQNLKESGGKQCVEFCKQGFYLNNTNECIDDCGNDSVGDTLNSPNKCILKVDCKNFVLDKSCIKSCPKDSKQQVKVNSSKQQYNQCVQECDSGYYSKDGVCFNDCGPNYLIDMKNKICIKSTECQSFVMKDKCLEFCPSETKILNKSLSKSGQNECVTECPKFHNVLTNQCVTECIDSILDLEKSQCIKKENCQNFILDNTCVKDCAKLYKQDKSQSGEQSICVQTCGKNLFQNEDKKECVKQCDSDKIGDTINSPNKCIIKTECKQFIQDKKCIKQWLNYCVEKCYPKFYLKQNECVSACDSNQLTDTTKNECIQPADCQDFVSGKECTQKCPENQYKLDKLQSEKPQSLCVLKCENLYLKTTDTKEKECVKDKNCGTNYLGDTSSQTCIIATECKDFIQDKTCTKKCLNDTYEQDKSLLNKPQSLCVANCEPPLLTKVDTKQCVNKCVDNYLLDPQLLKCIKPEDCKDINFDNKCLKTCPEKTKKQDKSQTGKQIQCVQECDPSFFFNIDTNECVKDCPVNFVGDTTTTNRNCILKAECKFYVQDKLCQTSCSNQFFKLNKQYVKDQSYNTCVQKCLPDLFQSSDSTECLQECGVNQIKDKINSKCIIKKELCTGFVIDDLTCEQSCTSNKFEYIDSSPYKICKSTCEYIIKDDKVLNKCSSACEKVKYTDKESTNNQKYCGFCPTNKYKLTNGTNNFCTNTCESNLFDNENMICLSVKTDCKNFLIDDKICSLKCPDINFLKNKIDGQSYIVCNTTCGGINFEYTDSQGIKKKYCDECPDFTFKSKADKKCLPTCPQITDKINKECVSDKNICKNILIDDTSCEMSCPLTKFLYAKDSQLPYTVCKSQCNDTKYTYEVNGTKKQYCNFCPDEANFKAKQGADNICQTECKISQILSDGNICLSSKDECKNYLVNDTICSATCPQQNFIQKKETNKTYQVCNQVCSSGKTTYQFTDSNNKVTLYCDFCPKDAPYRAKKDNKDVCLKQCETQSVEYSYIDSYLQIYLYCDFCPLNAPYRTKTKSGYTCSEKCQDSDVIDQENKICLISKNNCDNSRYLVDDKICQKDCPKNYFQQKDEKTSYKQCNSSCKDYYFNEDGQNYCQIKCSEGQISDPQKKQCYSDKKECLTFISNDGKKCVEKCNPATEYFIYNDTYNQCITCHNFIRADQDPSKPIQCIDKCESHEMIYKFKSNGPKLFKQCVAPSFCANKQISILNENVCSDNCLKPEINSSQGCVEACLYGAKYSIRDNKCTNTCDQSQFESSDGTVCSQSCEKIFEVIDQQVQNKKKCKKCEQNQFLSLDSTSKGACKPIIDSDKGRSEMKNNFLNAIKQIGSIQEVQKAQEQLKQYSHKVEGTLRNISNIASKTKDDQMKAQTEFQNIIDITQQLLSNIVDINDSQKPIQIGLSELKIVSQIAQQGKTFSTSFSSTQISQRNTSTLFQKNSGDENVSFDPQILTVSYLKNNHFCTLSDCDNAPPIYIVSYQNKQQRRLLESEASQTFEMVYHIPKNASIEKLLCFSYDENGYVSRYQGKILSQTQITCQFQYGSGLFQDTKCQYIDKSYCTPNLKEEEMKSNNKDNESDEVPPAAIAGIVIGAVLIISIFIILFMCRNKSQTKDNKTKRYIDKKQVEIDLENKETRVCEEV